MAAQVGALRVTVGADITGLQTGMKRAERQVQTSAGVMQRAVAGAQASFAGLGRGIIGGGVVATVLIGAQAFLKIADAAKTMTAQLRLATAEYGSFNQAQKDVRAIAESSRSSLTATAELYAAIQRNAGELGNTQAQTARMTETVSKSFAVYGATAVQAEQATRQLVQAFQSGRLSGDEFRTLMENAPRLMKLLADSLGVTTGKLREMAEAQTLTADKLIKAFSDLDLTSELDKEFAKMPVTFGQAMTLLYNSALVTFSAFDQGGQFSNSIAAFVTQGSEGFAELSNSAFGFGQAVSETFAAVDEIRQLLRQTETEGVGAFLGLADAAGTWHDALSGVLGVLDGVVNAFANLANAPGNIVRGARGDPLILDPADMQGGFESRTATAGGASIGSIAGGLLGGFGTGRTPPPFRAPAGKAKKPKRAPKPPRDKSEDVAFRFESELLDAQMDILKAQQELAGTVGERAELSLKMLDLEGQQFQADLDNNVRKAQRDLAEKKITETTFLEVQAHADALRIKHEEVDQLKRQAIMQEAALHRMERADALSERDFQNRLDGLEFTDEMATTQAEHRRVQLEIVDTLYKQKEAHLRALKAQLDFAGKIEEAADVQAEIDRLPSERGRERERVMRGTRSPLEDWAASVPQTADEIIEAFQRIEVDGIEGIADAMGEVIQGTKSLKDAFADAAQSIIAAIIQMTIRMLIFRALTAMFGGAFGGGSSGLTGNAAFAASGNVVGMASGGSFMVGGRGGVDNNLLSINGLPVARVSQGENVRVSPTGGAQTQRVIVELRDNMLDARIASGADVQIIRAYPGLKAGITQGLDERARRR